MKILSDNTKQIVALKNSFDSFLQDVATNFSQEFIKALNESIKQLNVQLQTQFGENFKELNAAVREVVAWQREYKQIVEKTTDELKVINETFNREVMGELKSSLKTFANTSEKNIAVQKNLSDAVIQLNRVVEQSKNSIQEMQTMTSNFRQFSDKVLQENEKAFKKYQGQLKTLADSLDKLEKEHNKQVEDNLKAVDKMITDFGTDMKKLKDTTLTFTTDTAHYLREFNKVSDSAMKEIRDAIDKFKADFSSETKKSVENLHKMFEELAKNTDSQSDKAVKNLAAALGAINNQMIANYSALIKRIAELDRIINESGRK